MTKGKRRCLWPRKVVFRQYLRGYIIQSLSKPMAPSWSGDSVALKTDGSVVVWGSNEYGQANVPAAALIGVVAIAAGQSHTVALKSDGSVLAWGDNSLGQVTVPEVARSGVTAIAAGRYFTGALLGTAIPLEARFDRDEIILSWLSNLVGFGLQTTHRLSSPWVWVNATNQPVIVDSRFTIVRSANGDLEYYRLQKP